MIYQKDILINNTSGGLKLNRYQIVMPNVHNKFYILLNMEITVLQICRNLFMKKFFNMRFRNLTWL